MQHELASSQPFLPFIQPALERQRLGVPESIFSKNAFGVWKLFGLVIAVLVTYALMAEITVVSNSPLVSPFWSTDLSLNLLQVLWIALALLTLALLVRAYLNRHRYLCVYPQELVSCTRTRAQRFALDGIQYLWRGWIVLGENQTISAIGIDALHLRMHDGRTFSLDKAWSKQNWSERNALCEAIERDFVSRRLPALLEQSDRGDSLDFPSGSRPDQHTPGSPLREGDLRISKTAVSQGTNARNQAMRALSWDMIECFQVGEDLIQIKKHGRSDDWYLSRTPQMANACLLRELVRQRYV